MSPSPSRMSRRMNVLRAPHFALDEDDTTWHLVTTHQEHPDE